MKRTSRCIVASPMSAEFQQNRHQHRLQVAGPCEGSKKTFYRRHKRHRKKNLPCLHVVEKQRHYDHQSERFDSLQI